jgi:hypothetical protein
MRRGVNLPWEGRGDIGGCLCRSNLEWTIELAHRSFMGLGDHECHTGDIYVWGLECGA